jgi:hypothetical protein
MQRRDDFHERPILFEHQELCQKSDRSCSVPVFARLSGISEEELMREVPGASEQKVTVAEWHDWLKGKGFTVNWRTGCHTDILPCVHLVANSPQDEKQFHWVYRAVDGGVHDPSPVFTAMSPHDRYMLNLEAYSIHVLTFSVERDGKTDMYSPKVASPEEDILIQAQLMREVLDKLGQE